MSQYKKKKRIRFESLLFSLIAVFTEIFLLYLYCIRNSLVQQKVFAYYVVQYGFWLGLVFLIPASIYLLCDFFISKKEYTKQQKELQKSLKKRELERALRQYSYDKFNEFYYKNIELFKKGSN